MGYTALEKMQEINRERYGIVYPAFPGKLQKKKNISNMEYECLSFLRESCEELRFDANKQDLMDSDGKSNKPGMIPFNMEKDLDRLCLENAIHRFMASGVAKDAFDVYFCYLEMFIGRYQKSRKMIEMLAEFESNASALLMKHRDHYSHSVYVFILGMAIYQQNTFVREAYAEYYGLADEKAAAHHFLKYWGMTSLFHDIGYPFELPFEEVKSYFGNSIDHVPFISYRGVDEYIRLSEDEKAFFEKLLGQPLKEDSINEVMSVHIASKLERVYRKDAETLCRDVLGKKPSMPDAFSGFMDHAYFSGVLLFRQLRDLLGVDKLTEVDLDVVSAIMLHNSMYKFSITNVKNPEKNKPFDIGLHPLAYLLMLCDELQCWDRTSYGKNSRQELHAMWCDLEFSENTIKAVYYYDERLEYKKDYAKGSYRKMTDERLTFIRDIEDIVRINQEGCLKLELQVKFIKNNRLTKQYMSSSSFLNLYHFAVALNGRYSYGKDHQVETEQLEEDFDRLSLEYKLSNILQAKAFASHLDAVGCFYTDRAVEYELLESFSQKQMDVIGPLEHARWLQEKKSMCWSYDTTYVDMPDSKRVRELTRTHVLMIDDYHELDEAEQNKDTEPMNCMLKLIEEYDGLRIYRIN